MSCFEAAVSASSAIFSMYKKKKIAWSQAQDAEGGGLCAGPATLPRKRFHATEKQFLIIILLLAK